MTKENTRLPLSVPSLLISLKFATAQQTGKERGIVRGEQKKKKNSSITIFFYICFLYIFVWKSKEIEDTRQWKNNLYPISSILKVLNGWKGISSLD